jgi:hypothetical protein
MPERWCTVTVTDPQGRRRSIDVLASSTYDAAHLYVAYAKTQPQTSVELPLPTTTTTFEVITGGRVYTVPGAALQQWIERRRADWKGPRAALFKRRPTLE